jgi:LysR family transcriptional regulator of gallate degradation
VHPKPKLPFPGVQLLLALRAVQAHGSTSAAAVALFRSQPAISQAIAQMEKHFATDLFVRTSTGMATTPAGEVVLRRVLRALDHLAAGIGPTAPRQLFAIGGAQLLALEAVAQAGGFGVAARATGLSRAGLHRACRALERTLGAALFETTSHGVVCTRDGAALARRVSLAAAELQQAHTEIAASSSSGNARIVIGAMPLARTSLVPDAVLQFAAFHPNHVVTLLDGPYETLLAALRRGAADLLVGALREPSPGNDVVQALLFDDPLAIVVRRGHPLLSQPLLCQPVVDAHALQAYPWIAPRVGTPLREHFETLFEGIGHPAGIVECNSLSVARALLRTSDHVMLLSAHQVGPDLDSGALALLPHPQGTVLRHIGITTRKDWHPTAVQAEFLAILRALGTGAKRFR